MSDNGSEFGSFIAGFLVGGLVGAAVALLLAPQSGEQTRTLIKDKSIEIKNKAVEEADTIKGRAEIAVTDFRTKAEEYARSKGWIPPEEQTQEPPSAEITPS
jgi:gas vesicle protein